MQKNMQGSTHVEYDCSQDAEAQYIRNLMFEDKVREASFLMESSDLVMCFVSGTLSDTNFKLF